MTSQWHPPDTLDPEVVYLVRQLRDLRERSGASLARLAAETPYSKSSWARYLNGSALPPRPAVRDLARIAGEPAPRLLALWERAEANWSGRAAGPVAPPRDAGPDRAAAPPPARHRRRRLRITVLVCAVPGLSALLVLPFTGKRDAAPPGPVAPDYLIVCRAASCAGKDAQAMDCGLDTRSFAGLQIGATYLELRISDQCAAAWSRVADAAVGDLVSVEDRDGRAETVGVSDAGMTGRFVTTGMIAAGRHSDVRACLTRAGERTCTTWGGDRQVPMPMSGTSRG
jgi:transcriptional regulator with XRE-family HTH domain